MEYKLFYISIDLHTLCQEFVENILNKIILMYTYVNINTYVFPVWWVPKWPETAYRKIFFVGTR